MRKAEPGLFVRVGVSASGKTYGVRESVYTAVRAGMPVMVLDRMREWGRVPRDLGDLVAGARSVAALAAAAAGGARLLIVRPPSGELEVAAAEACAWARDVAGVAGVAIPEAHAVMPKHGRLEPACEDVVTAWRHHHVALWVDTQRLALLSSHVVELARELHLHAMVGKRDLMVLRELGGPWLEAGVQWCARKLGAGEAGWHVTLDLIRVPPYVARRIGDTRTCTFGGAGDG